jgi:hypothetical protein
MWLDRGNVFRFPKWLDDFYEAPYGDYSILKVIR